MPHPPPSPLSYCGRRCGYWRYYLFMATWTHTYFLVNGRVALFSNYYCATLYYACVLIFLSSQFFFFLFFFSFFNKGGGEVGGGEVTPMAKPWHSYNRLSAVHQKGQQVRYRLRSLAVRPRLSSMHFDFLGHRGSPIQLFLLETHRTRLTASTHSVGGRL